MEERSCTEGGGRGRRGAAQKGRRRGEVEEGEGGQEAYRRGSCLVAAAMWSPARCGLPLDVSPGVVDSLPSPARFPLSPAQLAIPVTGSLQFPPIPPDSLPIFPPVPWAGARTP
jgi:hypothetical protein